MNLIGQVALITGAGGPDGIGYATARALAADGADVVLCATSERVHDRAAEITNLGGNAIGVVADLMEADAALRITRIALAIDDRIDILVNNAGMIAVAGATIGQTATDSALHATTDEEWDDGIHRNLTTCFTVTRAVVAHMRERGYGRVVNVASTSGAVQAYVGDVAYHAAKAGMVGFTRAVALESAAHGITVNAVAPGWIATGSQLPGEVLAGELSPMKRSGTAAEVAAAIRFLVDPAASYVTGQLLVVDGGNSLPEDRAWTP
ncbi:MAG: SDR family oxidoreductase [Ilumatobacteraceae bacterium]